MNKHTLIVDSGETVVTSLAKMVYCLQFQGGKFFMSICVCVCAHALAESGGISCGGLKKDWLASQARGSSDEDPRLVPGNSGMTL